MDLSAFGVRATAGSLRQAEGVVLPHTWTDEGVVAGPASNGAQLLHLSIALCVLNDTYREAARLGIEIDGVAVEVDGGFDDDWRSTGIAYSCNVDTRASAEEVAHLQAVVDEVAEIPRVIRAGAPVRPAAPVRPPERLDGSEDLSRVFDEEFARAPTAIEEQAALAALGDEYPLGLQTYSWVSRTELRLVADQVAASGARHLVDLGCGRGGPGVWVAAVSAASLVGVDIAASGLARGRELATRFGVAADFQVGSFEATGLPEDSADLVMSFDAFLFTPDKQQGFTELARILRPGGRLVMTSFDYDSQPVNRPPQVADHRPLAEAAGLTVLSYDETVDWRRRCTVFADFLLDRVEELAAESGVSPSDLRGGLEDMRTSMDCMSRRFLMVAQRPAS